jgi:hypothetical protein
MLPWPWAWSPEMSLPLNRGQLHFLLQLLLLGLLVGLACWPLNLVDHAQELLLQRLPNFAGGAWTLQGLAIALAPVLVMPALLWLQAGRWARAYPKQSRASRIPSRPLP